MLATASRHMPGLYFETQAPEPREVLPRLDIAAFVGFAASGPVGVPVAVEDAVAFEELYGADLVLGVPGRQVRTELAPAVRAFFRNGGRRCWVVRVAGPPPQNGNDRVTSAMANDGVTSAIANEFVLPGILAVGPRTGSSLPWKPAVARARSEGSWSDDIAVNTTLLATPLPPGAVSLSPVESPPKGPSFSVLLDTGQSEIRAGELLQVAVSGSPYTAFVNMPPDLAPDARGRIEVPWSDALWLEVADPEPWPFGPAAIRGARHVLPSGAREPVGIVRGQQRAGTLTIELIATGGRPLREGSWIELDVVAPGALAADTWLLQVDGTAPSPPSGSPPTGGAGLAIEARRAWRFVDPPIGLPDDATIQVNALTFELWTRDGRGRSVRLADLGFAEGHPRSWADLPTDTELHSSPELALADRRTLARAASQPRFPLAGPALEAARGIVFLPLGVPAATRGEVEARAEPRVEPRVVRDGLDRIGADLFLDPALRDTSPDRLMEHAFRVRYGRDGRANRPLRGLHALIYIDEISLIAAPDGLLERLPSVSMRAAPPGVTLSATVTDTQLLLEWPGVTPTGPTDTVVYTLEWSETADFGAPSGSERLEPGKSDALVTDDPIGRCKRRLDRPRGICAPDRWYRVRVEGLSGGGPWSNTVRVRPAAATFDACHRVGAEAPALSFTRSIGHVTFAWTDTGTARYELESASEPTFSASERLFDGRGLTFSMLAPPTMKYVRVRALTQPPGAWSNSVQVQPDAEVTPPSDMPVNIEESTALDVNAALLRFCAARGDVFAVLGTPRTFSEDEVLAHKAQLVAPQLSREDRLTPSFGALYFPWLVIAGDGGPHSAPQTVAPVGTICGLIAARTLAHGAWYAPANRLLAGVVSRSRAVDKASWAKLEAAHVNAVWLEPNGYVTLGAHTLTPDHDLREISVRRLLILLRRLVLREGPSLVFEPNDSDLRRAVRRQFERLLSQLFMRGALAGRKPAEAFQVVVDDTTNPPQGVDRGRLVVELRVAPSRPLAFLIVRFVLRGGSATVEVV